MVWAASEKECKPSTEKKGQGTCQGVDVKSKNASTAYEEDWGRGSCEGVGVKVKNACIAYEKDWGRGTCEGVGVKSKNTSTAYEKDWHRGTCKGKRKSNELQYTIALYNKPVVGLFAKSGQMRKSGRSREKVKWKSVLKNEM